MSVAIATKNKTTDITMIPRGILFIILALNY
jgi:hypothetical protein